MQKYRVKEPIRYGSNQTGYKWLLEDDILLFMCAENNSTPALCSMTMHHFCNLRTREEVILSVSDYSNRIEKI